MTFSALQTNTAFNVEVHTTNNRGFTPEEIAERCAHKILAVSETAPEAIKAQAHAFRKDMVKVLEVYMREAIKSDRTTVYNELIHAGHRELAELIRRL